MEVRTEKEESKNQGDQGVTIGQLIDKRTKKQILNDPNQQLTNYINPFYPIIKKKPLLKNVSINY